MYQRPTYRCFVAIEDGRLEPDALPPRTWPAPSDPRLAVRRCLAYTGAVAGSLSLVAALNANYHPAATRTGADRYALSDGTTVLTRDCAAEQANQTRVDRRRGVLHFADAAQSSCGIVSVRVSSN